MAPSVRYLDVAADAAKYGRISDQPWLEATIPSLVDPLLVDGGAAAGVRHVMSVLVQSAPRPAARRRLGRRAGRRSAHRTMARAGVGRTRHRRAWSWHARCTRPADLERDLGMTGGHPLHGEPSLDQWFAWRPMLGYARYRMPLDGLYLCGAGAHPGWRRDGRARAATPPARSSPTRVAAAARTDRGARGCERWRWSSRRCSWRASLLVGCNVTGTVYAQQAGPRRTVPVSV